MQRYVVDKEIGEGAFGKVFRAVKISDGKTVAMKQMKRRFPEWSGGLALREIRCLRKLMKQNRHPNIVEIYEVIRNRDESMVLVFECMPENLLEYMQRALRRRELNPIWHITEPQIREISRQILQGIEHLHRQGFVHRDIKPENILVDGNVCKVADFGLAREVSNSLLPCTDYVTTRWYRAIEVCLRSPRHDPPVDMFALGCVIAELYNLYPLFPGETELDQINLITKALGSPNKYNWPEGVALAAKIPIKFSRQVPVPLSNVIRSASSDGIALLGRLLNLNPQRRITATAALSHKFFVTTSQGVPPPAAAVEHRRVSASPHAKQDKERADSESSSLSIDLVVGIKRPCPAPALSGNGIGEGNSPNSVVNPYSTTTRRQRV